MNGINLNENHYAQKYDPEKFDVDSQTQILDGHAIKHREQKNKLSDIIEYESDLDDSLQEKIFILIQEMEKTWWNIDTQARILINELKEQKKETS